MPKTNYSCSPCGPSSKLRNKNCHIHVTYVEKCLEDRRKDTSIMLRLVKKQSVIGNIKVIVEKLINKNKVFLDIWHQQCTEMVCVKRCIVNVTKIEIIFMYQFSSC